MMSDKIVYKFVDANETIESRGYKKAVKSFQNKFPNYKWVYCDLNKYFYNMETYFRRRCVECVQHP